MKPKYSDDVGLHQRRAYMKGWAFLKSGTVMNIATRKFLLASAGLIILTAPAAAADMTARSYKAPPAPAPLATVYNWTGFYIGGHVGGAWAGNNTLQSNGGRFLGGVQAGADYQFNPNWVVGLEGQYSWLASTNSGGFAFPVAGVATENTRGLGSATARVGWTWGPGLLYAKGGYAFADRSLGVTVAGVPAPFAATGNSKSGWTVGGGLEYMFAPSWSVKGEYQYYNFGNTTFAAGPPALVGNRFRDDEHTVKVGVNYRFGWH
jgi:outer membrane immunogenic protein